MIAWFCISSMSLNGIYVRCGRGLRVCKMAGSSSWSLHRLPSGKKEALAQALITFLLFPVLVMLAFIAAKVSALCLSYLTTWRLL